MLFRVFTVLAVLALGVSTWILSSPARRPHLPSDARQADLPGYYLKNAVLTDFDLNGAPGIRIEAERIDQVDHSSEVALYNVRVAYQAPTGQAWTMIGDTAHVEPGGKVVDVAGNVRLQGEASGREGAAIIRTDTLSYDVADSIASTKSDVRIEFGQHTLTARGLVANLKERTLRLESKVNGRFHP
jgi:LPS export ABC transporter protein LptC